MKKLLAFVLVLAVASIANAAILELSVGGTVNGPGAPAEIILLPSETVMIDVQCTAAPDADDWWLTIEGPGSIEGMGTIYSPPAPAAAMTIEDYGTPWYYFSTTGSPVPAPLVGKWWDSVFHCDGLGDVIITLWDEGGVVIEDTIIIHQVPEPVTMSLLGLGGLALIRRRHA